MAWTDVPIEKHLAVEQRLLDKIEQLMELLEVSHNQLERLEEEVFLLEEDNRFLKQRMDYLHKALNGPH